MTNNDFAEIVKIFPNVLRGIQSSKQLKDNVENYYWCHIDAIFDNDFIAPLTSFKCVCKKSSDCDIIPFQT